MADDRIPFKPDVEPELTRQGVDINRIEGLTYLDYSSYHRMCDFLKISDVDRRDPKIAEKVSYITDWAADVSKSTNEVTQMKAIKKLTRDIGESHIGLDLLDTLNRYARLDKDKRSIEEEMGIYKEEDENKEKEYMSKDIRSLKKQITILSEKLEKKKSKPKSKPKEKPPEQNTESSQEYIEPPKPTWYELIYGNNEPTQGF